MMQIGAIAGAIAFLSLLTGISAWKIGGGFVISFIAWCAINLWRDSNSRSWRWFWSVSNRRLLFGFGPALLAITVLVGCAWWAI